MGDSCMCITAHLHVAVRRDPLYGPFSFSLLPLLAAQELRQRVHMHQMSSSQVDEDSVRRACGSDSHNGY